ncbi:MAG: DUF4760 domain-containing protein [Candidatus Heimdallarchaeaceae archaeon]|jgi:hypothetical protein
MSIEGIAAIISVTIVFITFLVGYLERRNSNRRRRTLEFLLTVIVDEGPIQDVNLEFANWISEGRVFKNDEVNPEEDRLIIKLLDFYDLISDTVKRGIIDKEMTILHLGGRMNSTYEMLINYIYTRRERLDRPMLYMPFENFVIKEIKDKKV